MRHRFSLWDGAVFLVVAALLLFFAFEYDFLLGEGLSQSNVAGIGFGEGMLIIFVLATLAYVALRRLRAQEREVTRRVAAEQQARSLAFHDPLTGLANRRQFDLMVATAVASPPGADRSHAVLMLDLNGFKSINDTFGHPAGDEVLQEIGRRLEAVVRESGDHVARLGGDEFGIVATQLWGAEDASGIALRVIACLERPIRAHNADHQVGTGIGIALFPRDGDTAEEIVRRADVALYRAKLGGRSAVRFFEADMDRKIQERAMIERELRAAIAAGSIVPHYQAVVELGSGRITGFEALARWHHPTLGDVPPDRFIPVAESGGLISELSDQLLRVACRDAVEWPAGTTLAFNVSPVQLQDAGFGLRVLAILGETGLSPRRLEIEITENTLVKDLEAAENTLGRLRDVGVRIALDDFGTGYSSLYHLRKFKFDRIKIDRSFVESMDDESESGEIVRALIGLGHGLGVPITAEGIEGTSQRDALIADGCDQGQGFLYSRAVAGAAVQALFDAENAKPRRLA